MIDAKRVLRDFANDHDQTVATVSVAMLIKNRFHQVLMVERKTGDLQIPSGKLKPGEKPAFGAKREVLEETGMQFNFSKPDQIIYASNPDGLMSIGIIFYATSDVPENWTTNIVDEDISRAKMMHLGDIVTAYESQKIFKPNLTMQALYPWLIEEYSSSYDGLSITLGSKSPTWLKQYSTSNI